MPTRRWTHPDLLWGAGILLLLSLPFIFSDLDLTLAGLFYRNGWGIGEQPLWQWLYRYSTLPGLIFAAGALILWIGSTLRPAWVRWRRAAALIVLTLLLGPGLLVNAVGKNYVGRSRPREVTAFGGLQPFQRLGTLGSPGRGKSFPSGHPSVGYLIAVLYFIDRRRRFAWLSGGLGYGTLIGVARMAQGGHFASDVLWAGGLTWLSAAALHHLILPRSSDTTAPGSSSSRWQRVLAWTALSALLPLLAALFVVATPYYKEWSRPVPLPPGLTHLRLNLPAGLDEIIIEADPQAEALFAQAEYQGFGFPKLRLNGALDVETRGTTLTARLAVTLHGLVTEQRSRATFRVHPDLVLSLTGEALNSRLRLGPGRAPVRYGEVRVTGLRGTEWTLLPNSELTGPVVLNAETGDVLCLSSEIRSKARGIKLDLGTLDGTVTWELHQTEAFEFPLQARLWAKRGTVKVFGKIGPPCQLDLTWDEAAGQSLLKADGLWRQQGKRVQGPRLEQPPDLRMHAAIGNGRIQMELTDLTPAAGRPSRGPAEADDAGADWVVPERPAAETPEAANSDLEWVEREGWNIRPESAAGPSPDTRPVSEDTR